MTTLEGVRQTRHCERKAKQSRSRGRPLDCFVAALLAMTAMRRVPTRSPTISAPSDKFGAKTIEFEQDGVPYFVNEFWTSGQRQAHALHEISYRACFKPQLPQFFISRLTARRESVYDPFMGRGTTLVQAALQGRRPVGNDINPLSGAADAPTPRAADA